MKQQIEYPQEIRMAACILNITPEKLVARYCLSYGYTPKTTLKHIMKKLKELDDEHNENKK